MTRMIKLLVNIALVASALAVNSANAEVKKTDKDWSERITRQIEQAQEINRQPTGMTSCTKAGLAGSSTDVMFHCEKDSRNGDPDSTFFYGSQYEKGWGKQVNYKKAREYYAIAVKGGSYIATDHMAIIYVNEIGVKRDMAQAWSWWVVLKSFNQKEASERASKHMATYREYMTADEIAEGERLGAERKKLYGLK